MISQNKYFFSICFSEYVECSFDDSAEKLPPKLRKKIKNTVFLRWKYFPSTNSSGQVECSFENLDGKIHQKSNTFFLQVQKNFVKIRVLPQRNYLLQNVSLDTQNAGLTTPTIKIRWQCEKLLLKKPKSKISPKKTFSSRILLWICSLQFYNSAGSFSLEVRKSKERNNVFLKTNIFSRFVFLNM